MPTRSPSDRTPLPGNRRQHACTLIYGLNLHPNLNSFRICPSSELRRKFMISNWNFQLLENFRPLAASWPRISSSDIPILISLPNRGPGWAVLCLVVWWWRHSPGNRFKEISSASTEMLTEDKSRFHWHSPMVSNGRFSHWKSPLAVSNGRFSLEISIGFHWLHCRLLAASLASLLMSMMQAS